MEPQPEVEGPAVERLVAYNSGGREALLEQMCDDEDYLSYRHMMPDGLHHNVECGEGFTLC